MILPEIKYLTWRRQSSTTCGEHYIAHLGQLTVPSPIALSDLELSFKNNKRASVWLVSPLVKEWRGFLVTQGERLDRMVLCSWITLNICCGLMSLYFSLIRHPVKAVERWADLAAISLLVKPGHLYVSYICRVVSALRKELYDYLHRWRGIEKLCWTFSPQSV